MEKMKLCNECNALKIEETETFKAAQEKPVSRKTDAFEDLSLSEIADRLEMEHRIDYLDIYDFIQTPVFTDEIKNKIFDVVRKIGFHKTKDEIKELFAVPQYSYNPITNDYEKEMVDIEYVMSKIEIGYRRTLDDEFFEEYLSLVYREIAAYNLEFGKKDCFQDAIVDCSNDIFADIGDEWKNQRITLDEWKNLFLSLAE